MVQEIALTKRATDNPEALDYYMRGREFRYKSRRKNLDFAIELFQKAIELDRWYASAYAGLSEAYSSLYENHGRNLADLTRSAEASLKAIMYDSGSAEAHAALGLTYFYQGQIHDAEQACLKAIELDPNLFMGYRNLGRIYHLSDRDPEAVEMIKKGIELKPDDYTMIGHLETILHRLGRNEEKDEWQNKLFDLLQRHLLRDPEDIHGRVFYAGTLARSNQRDEALAQARIVLEADSTDGLTLYNVACVLSLVGDYEHAIEGLQKSIHAGHTNYEWFKRDSDLDPIRNHPGYIELMKDK
jgi:adenylate cyclase